jgi:basic amino acid/polyamine antiporter, APA family
MTASGSSPEPGESADTQLVRALGVRQLAALIFNYIVGAGIFVLPALAATRLGPAAVLAYLVCAVIVGLMVLCFAEAGSRVAATGGPYAYAEAAFGSYVAFIVGALTLLSAALAMGAVSGLFAGSLLALTGVTSPIARPLVMVGVVGAVAWVNVRGLKGGARTVEVATVVKLVPLAAFVVFGAFAVKLPNLTWPALPSASDVFATAGFIFLAFAGIESALQPSGEVRNPERTVPRAALLAMAAVVVLYLSVQLVAQGILGAALVDEGVAPLASAAGAAYGPPARALMLVAAIASMFGHLCGAVLGGPRSVFALGRDGFLPRVLASVHPVRHTPHVAILSFATLSLAIGLSGTFEQLAILTNLSVLSVYFVIALVAWRLRVLNVRFEGEPFGLRGGPLVPVLACAAIGAVVVATVSAVEVAAMGAAIAAATAIYVVRSLRLRPNGAE